MHRVPVLESIPVRGARAMRTDRAGFVLHLPGGWMIQALRRLNEPASDSHLGIALVLAAVVTALMLWAIIWQANIIAYQRDLIRELSIARFGGKG
jgi:hypothetical protein